MCGENRASERRNSGARGAWVPNREDTGRGQRSGMFAALRRLARASPDRHAGRTGGRVEEP
jgi:hypothetical protein